MPFITSNIAANEKGGRWAALGIHLVQPCLAAVAHEL
jgi:hypothetical protein